MILKARAHGANEIIAELKQLENIFDLDRNELGQTLLNIATEEILNSMDREQDPDGRPWPPLSSSYLEYKLEIAPQAPMGVLFGRMKTYEQIAGNQYIYRKSASMEYGLDPMAQAEAVKFTFGGTVTGTNQPPRPFYGLTIDAAMRCELFLANYFDTTF